MEKLCNFCGMTCCLETYIGPQPHGLIDQQVVGGYDSTPGNGFGALDTMYFYQFSLCEFCLDRIFYLCKIPPKVFADGEEVPFRHAAQRVVEDDWRRDKTSFFKEKDKRFIPSIRRIVSVVRDKIVKNW